jgi:hypothetical protein
MRLIILGAIEHGSNPQHLAAVKSLLPKRKAKKEGDSGISRACHFILPFLQREKRNNH